MDIYECFHCGNEWPDYEPMSCPFCFSQEIRIRKETEHEAVSSVEGNRGSTVPLVDTVSGRSISKQ